MPTRLGSLDESMGPPNAAVSGLRRAKQVTSPWNLRLRLGRPITFWSSPNGIPASSTPALNCTLLTLPYRSTNAPLPVAWCTVTAQAVATTASVKTNTTLVKRTQLRLLMALILLVLSALTAINGTRDRHQSTLVLIFRYCYSSCVL